MSIESFISALDHLLLMEMALYKLNTLLLLLLLLYETVHCDTPLNQPGNRIYDAVLPVADWVVQTVRR